MKKKPNSDPTEGKQTNLAEGERDTVEESIRIHEKKGDLKSERPSDEEADDAA